MDSMYQLPVPPRYRELRGRRSPWRPGRNPARHPTRQAGRPEGSTHTLLTPETPSTGYWRRQRTGYTGCSLDAKFKVEPTKIDKASEAAKAAKITREATEVDAPEVGRLRPPG